MKRSGSSPRIALDTSAYAHFRAGHAGVLDLLASAETVFVPVVVLGELEAGFELGSRARANRVSLEEFLAEPFVSIVDVTPAVARRYGSLFSALRRAGTPIPVNDIWIAACAIESAARVVTFDRDFERIAKLDVTVLAG